MTPTFLPTATHHHPHKRHIAMLIVLFAFVIAFSSIASGKLTEPPTISAPVTTAEEEKPASQNEEPVRNITNCVHGDSLDAETCAKFYNQEEEQNVEKPVQTVHNYVTKGK